MEVFEVEMRAFRNGEIREVEVENPADDIDSLLEQIFKYGQNDFQPKAFPSVSMGDVIRIDGTRYRVGMFGFEEVSLGEEA